MLLDCQLVTKAGHQVRSVDDGDFDGDIALNHFGRRSELLLATRADREDFILGPPELVHATDEQDECGYSG